MTFKEKLQMEYPEIDNVERVTLYDKCPENYGYEEPFECPQGLSCKDCWDREIPEEKMPEEEKRGMTFKVGDKVQLKKGLDENKTYAGLRFHNFMRFAGTAKITRVWSTGNLNIDINDDFVYSPEMLEPALTAEEAWEIARRICKNPLSGGLKLQDLHEIFGTISLSEIMTGYTASEAAEKIRKWEESKGIRYGDVVEFKGKKWVAVGAFGEHRTNIINAEISTIAETELLKKLGHIDLDKLMEDIDAD